MKIKIGVIFGGKSVEHEVSIISAIQAINNIDKEKYDIIPIYLTKNNEMYVGNLIGDIVNFKDIKKLLENSQRILMVNTNNKTELIKYPFKKFGNNVYDYIDIAFPIVHGTNVEDGTLQGYLQMLNIPYVGCDITASAVGMDKYITKTILKDNGIPVLDCLVVNKVDFIENEKEILKNIKNKFEYPIIVKPINLGSSVGIQIANNQEQLNDCIDNAFQYAKQVLVEKAIKNLREINCSVMGDISNCKASECEEPISSGNILSYDDKYLSNNGKGPSKGMSSLDRKLPADITVETKEMIKNYANQTFKLLNCNGVVRIDFMIDLDTDTIYVNEINTIPGSLSFYLWEASDLKYKDLLSELINLSLKRQREDNSITYKFDTNILENFNGSKKSGNKKF